MTIYSFLFEPECWLTNHMMMMMRFADPDSPNGGQSEVDSLAQGSSPGGGWQAAWSGWWCGVKMGMWIMALAAVAGLMLPEWPPRSMPAKEVGYSEFLTSLDKVCVFKNWPALRTRLSRMHYGLIRGERVTCRHAPLVQNVMPLCDAVTQPMMQGQVRECEVGVDDVLRYKLKNNDAFFASRIVTAPKELTDKMMDKGVSFKQARRPSEPTLYNLMPRR